MLGLDAHCALPSMEPMRRRLAVEWDAASSRANWGERLATQKNVNGSAPLGFEQKLWAAADKMRGHMDPAEY